MLLKNRIILTMFDEIDPSWEEGDSEIAARVKNSSGILDCYGCCKSKSSSKTAASTWHNKATGADNSAKYNVDGGFLKNLSRSDKAIDLIVGQMGIIFCSPEYIICHDLSESRDLFFIQAGDCVVNVRDINFVPA
jgi:hypothetical protein